MKIGRLAGAITGQIRAINSMAEYPAHNRGYIGSNPMWPTNRLVDVQAGLLSELGQQNQEIEERDVR